MIPDPRLPDPAAIRIIGGSFRDPSGYVFGSGDRIFRTVNPCAAERFGTLRDSGLLAELQRKHLIVATHVLPFEPGVEQAFRGRRGETPTFLLEHPRIPLITYPYEWCFSQLKDAALAHLDLQIVSLESGFALSDSTPYNMQFWNGRPIHIDVLSLRPYREGEPWQGYNQFCRLFLAPLLLEAWAGVSFQPILRGRIDGLPLAEVARLLPRRRLFTSLQAFLHVHLHGKAESAASSSRLDRTRESAPVLSKPRYRALLLEMRRFVSSLSSGRRSKSFWQDYAAINSYTGDMRVEKAAIVRDFVARNKQASIVDVGGNSGDYSMAALEAGAASAIVLDGDNDAIEAAYRRARSAAGGLSAWLVDVGDPSPAMGWGGRERDRLEDRLGADGILALAVIHHMCIGRNIPLGPAIAWLVSLAPRGLIEFVPKEDPMVAGLLYGREDLFGDYDLEHFLAYLGERATVVGSTGFEDGERVVVEYERF